MHIDTPPEAINREALLFGLMVGVIATTAATLLSDIGFLLAALLGAILALVVWFVVTRLGGDLAPPRGEGNVETDTVSQAPAPAPKPNMPEPVVVSPDLQASPPSVAPLTAATPGERPEALPSARDSGADDLKQLKGVGPKLEELLHTLGIYHFDQIAEWTPEHVAWMDENLEGFKGRVSRDDWVGQARSLASG